MQKPIVLLWYFHYFSTNVTGMQRIIQQNTIIAHSSFVNNARYFSTKVHARRDKADRYFI